MTEERPHARRLLHVGCGPKRLTDLPQWFHDGWAETRLDVDRAARPDIIAEMPELSAVESGGYDAIWSAHNLEHLFPHDAAATAREFHRVLRDDGFLIASTPDLRLALLAGAKNGLDATVYASPSGPISARDMLFGHQPSIRSGKTFMAHRNGFDLKSLNTLLSGAGFARVYGETRPVAQLFFLASKSSIGVDAAREKLADIIGERRA